MSLCLWREGEVITHQKLNAVINSVNNLAGMKQEEINKNNSANPNEYASSTSVPVQHMFTTACRYVHEMWNQDGEGRYLDGWDCNSFCEPGLFARANGFMFYPASECSQSLYAVPPNELKKIKEIEEIQCGDVLYQRIDVDPLSNSAEGTLELHRKNWHPCYKPWSENQVGWFYRPLTRMISDCGSGYVGEPDGVSVFKRWRAIQTNTSQVWPLSQGSASENFHNICIPNFGLDGQQIATHPTKYRQGAQEYDISNVWNYRFSGIRNGGGLQFFTQKNSDYTPQELACNKHVRNPFIRSGIEIYKAKVTETENESGEPSTKVDILPLPNDYTPVPTWDDDGAREVACWPKIKRKWQWCADEWKKIECKKDGSIKLFAAPYKNNPWQIVFWTNGAIEHDCYQGESSSGDSIEYIFDEEWFCVIAGEPPITRAKVKLKESKINEVANSIAVNTTVSACIIETLDESVYYNGSPASIIAEVTGLDCLSATANQYTQYK